MVLVHVVRCSRGIGNQPCFHRTSARCVCVCVIIGAVVWLVVLARSILFYPGAVPDVCWLVCFMRCLAVLLLLMFSCSAVLMNVPFITTHFSMAMHAALRSVAMV